MTATRNRLTAEGYLALDQAIIAAVAEEAPVTLRRVFYRVSSAGLIEKTEKGYRQVGRRLVKLRRSGRVPYDDVVDSSRDVGHGDGGYNSVTDYLRAIADPENYIRSHWDDQPVEVMVLSEKEAIRGVVDPITIARRVRLAFGRGYGSETWVWQLGMEVRDAGKPVVIFQLGDHDPSGVDAWRDIREKITAFAPEAEIRFERVAVTVDQITDLDLPTRPTKDSDTRAARFDGASVEVDAIPAPTLRALLDEAIAAEIDQEAWTATDDREAVEREELTTELADLITRLS